MPEWIWRWKAAYSNGRETLPKGRRNGIKMKGLEIKIINLGIFADAAEREEI